MTAIAQQLTTAVQHHQTGRVAEAESLYRAVLAVEPDQADALHLLGVLLYQRGRHAEAVELIERALAILGPHPVFHSNLAAVYLELDRLDDTVTHARAALRLQPNLANAHHNLGVALMRQEQHEPALAAFTEAVRLDPGHIEARCNRAATLHRLGRAAEALACAQEALQLAPDHPQAHNDLGGVLMTLDRHDEAIGHLREAIRLRPAYAEAHGNLGMALRARGALDEAIASLRTALQLNPRNADTHNSLAYALECKGQIDQARAELLQAVALAPDNPRTLAGLSALDAAGYYELSPAEIDRIRTQLTRSDLRGDHAGRLHFALARVLDRDGAYDEAFAHYRAGNQLRQAEARRHGDAFDPERQRRLIDRVIATFSTDYFERVNGMGVASQLPIFIVGMPRSGTTLIEQILASHPQVYGAGELPDVPELILSLPHRLQTTEPYPECMTHLDAPAVQRIAVAHLERLQQMAPGAVRVVDKMPFNFQHLGLIAALFPHAQIIHCRRDPRDTCLSCYLQNFGEPHHFTLDLGHLASYYRAYERLMSHWRQVLPVPMLEVLYEALIDDPATWIRRVIAYCGLEWDERCLRFYETERPVQTASMLQVRKPLYRSAVGRWQRYEKHLQPLMQALDAGEMDVS
jgi:tetratricopeptide (TPR) repeat protein